ncbi:MAG: manganese-dependent inorganic pyrophosphatase [Paracoccus sp. (in: a-proteobacteria)]|jgi:manganese-dependent inorganic pyrophosphatase|uniref:manganese-dependent inorganic pyrophosphatase n=1 Tax=unclassified Paracoccus (in: a-proteobacteria) TaxID=2688777 RepID=UPI000C433806|nr:manganese-dependent inorganic pyrophosphatase [Paracoccus sp. UBA5162]MAN57150.1 manganese-dependent inorganic pyrophosphatase [Paracoccus sp. (in: a-proteobacteria)]HIC66818.1 manganese-dependent inorganic pyrophosphatase [Paracoccus sp. (in: a-proteobacteria)]|tara:strand:- start:12433 stop:13350 length:918 start_codon:yes stop_codon:yes gene_type:complete
MIKVFGHTSPDTDSTGSPIVWAWYLNEIRQTPAKPVLLGEPNTEAGWMLTRWNLDKPEILTALEPGEKCVIVDTNNPAELPDGINDADVIEIIDHHMLAGGIKTRTPINITIRPLACTATILHDLMGEDADRAPEGVKAAMLTCILSDTLEFRSPTTTPHDRALAERLAADLGIDIAEYAAEMFAAKSDVSAFADDQLLRMDSKEYKLDGTQLRVSVLETTAPQVLLDRKAGLMAAMPAVAQADGAEQVLLFIVDILKQEATLLVPNDAVRRIAEKSFGVTVTGDSIVLPGVMSRKKQIIPVLAL